MVNNGFFKWSDPYSTNYEIAKDITFVVPDTWWSREYEYRWFQDQPIHENHIVCDMGTGYVYRPLKDILSMKSFQVVAVDADPRVMETRCNENVLQLVSPMETFEFDCQFDAVTCCSVLEETINPFNVLENFKRLIKTDGRIYLTMDAVLDPSKPVGQYKGIDLDAFFGMLTKLNLVFVGDLDMSKDNCIYNGVLNLCVFHCVLANRRAAGG